jgi:hypothetical protein
VLNGVGRVKFALTGQPNKDSGLPKVLTQGIGIHGFSRGKYDYNYL